MHRIEPQARSKRSIAASISGERKVPVGKPINHEDEKYSYVALGKGVQFTEQRASETEQPQQSTHLHTLAETHSRTQAEMHTQVASGGVAQRKARVIEAPQKRGGHVHMRVCSPRGRIERHTIARSTGKLAYKSARKARWSDLYLAEERTLKEVCKE
jgi:ribosomal protein RSM22 (predicted rRNA methylase)